VTKGKGSDFYYFDEKTNTVFYQSTENGSINRAIYRIALNGKSKLALSDEIGTNDATFSPITILYQYVFK
jgi:dipeptidyl-peptidase-4